MSQIVLIRVTCPSQRVAEAIADPVIDQKLAACANIEGPISSTYRWKGVVEQAFEFILWLKAPEANFGAIAAVVQDHHPYDVPAIVALPCLHISPAYADWVLQNTEHA